MGFRQASPSFSILSGRQGAVQILAAGNVVHAKLKPVSMPTGQRNSVFKSPPDHLPGVLAAAMVARLERRYRDEVGPVPTLFRLPSFSSQGKFVPFWTGFICRTCRTGFIIRRVVARRFQPLPLSSSLRSRRDRYPGRATLRDGSRKSCEESFHGVYVQVVRRRAFRRSTLYRSWGKSVPRRMLFSGGVRVKINR